GPYPLGQRGHAARTPPPARATRPVPPGQREPRGSYTPASASHAAGTHSEAAEPSVRMQSIELPCTQSAEPLTPAPSP
ncbi:MAG TPA: hypothetical protein VI197_12155, partial [Polyangiaceae bacterium]